MSKTENKNDQMGSLRLGIVFSVIMFIGFFGFIALGIAAPDTLSIPVFPKHRISIGLVYGIGLILSSATTTLVYALQADLALQPRKH